MVLKLYLKAPKGTNVQVLKLYLEVPKGISKYLYLQVLNIDLQVL